MQFSKSRTVLAVTAVAAATLAVAAPAASIEFRETVSQVGGPNGTNQPSYWETYWSTAFPSAGSTSCDKESDSSRWSGNTFTADFDFDMVVLKPVPTMMSGSMSPSEIRCRRRDPMTSDI